MDLINLGGKGGLERGEKGSSYFSFAMQEETSYLGEVNRMLCLHVLRKRWVEAKPTQGVWEDVRSPDFQVLYKKEKQGATHKLKHTENERLFRGRGQAVRRGGRRTVGEHL